MKAIPIMMVALALSLSADSLLAQNDGQPPQGPPGSQNDGPPDGSGPGPGRRHRPPPMPIVLALDANHDGVISADEIANAPAALKTLDKNGDGQLTKDEYLPARPNKGDGNGPQDGPPPGDAPKQPGQDKHTRPVPPIITALDTNGDGVISADEIANASASLMKLDKNGDGKLTMDEMMPPRPPRDGNGPDGQGQGQRPPPPDQNN